MNVVSRILLPLRQRSTYAVLLYLASGLPLGIAWLVLLVTGYATALGLTITLVGIPLLMGVTYVVAGVAALERRLASRLLGVEIVPTRRPLRGRLLARIGGWLRDGAAWRELAYVALRASLGVVIGLGVVSGVATIAQLVAYPTFYWATDRVVVGDLHVDTLGWAVVASVTGLLAIPALAWIVVGLGEANRRVAIALLGRVPGRALHAPQAIRIARRRALVLHGALAVALVILMLGIWGATTPGGYPWPVWVAFGLSIPLGIHAIAVLIPSRPGPHGRAVRALLVTSALAALLVLEMWVVWALTTPGGYPWPAWVLLGVAIPVGAHAIWVLAPSSDPARRALWSHGAAAVLLFVVLALIWAGTTPGGEFWPAWVLIPLVLAVAIHGVIVGIRSESREELTERVQVLTETRAGAVDAQAAELRRIERDLHDGAQARLTALAMDLGMAREKLGSDPASASLLVTEAHQEAKRALAELRDLARGIHPAVLGDRGLDAAISAISSGGAVRVHVDVSTGGRLPAAVEGAAYFVVAECLANARKHSGATSASVRVARRGGVLVVEVSDDGIGGADVTAGGLDGLRRRVEALDGRLTVVSEPGAGTWVQAEIPCES